VSGVRGETRHGVGCCDRSDLVDVKVGDRGSEVIRRSGALAENRHQADIGIGSAAELPPAAYR